MMKKFSLEEYLKNPDRKVVTKSGDEVTIIYTKANKEWPVVALINDSVESGMAWQFSENGESMPADDGSIYYGGLFFADEEEPLTEFEDNLAAIIDSWCDGNGKVYGHLFGLKKDAGKLLELARKQLDSEHDGKAMFYVAEKQYEKGKRDGKAEALKDLPKWKRMRGGLAGNLNDKAFLVKRKYSYSLESSVSGDDEYIILKDLDKLPKE